MRTGQSDKRWLFYFSVIVILVSTFPYFLGFSLSQDELVFTGFVFGVEDGNSYIAKMLSGAEGDWLFKSPYSAYEHKGFLAFFPYLLLGKLTFSPSQHEQLVALFHIFRWFAIVLLIFSIFRFLGLFIQDSFLHRVATVIATVGGGLGWLSIFGVSQALSIDLPLEFYSPETFGFLSVLGLPHLVAARALLFMGLTAYLQGGQSVKSRWIAVVSWLGIGFFQPLTIVTGWALLAAHLAVLSVPELIRSYKKGRPDLVALKPYYMTAIWLVGSTMIWVLYNLFSFSLNPYLNSWESQNIIQSPPIIDYLFSFGLLLPFVIVWIWRTLKRPLQTVTLFLCSYVLVFPLLAYAPHNLQRRLPDGIWIALVAISFLYVESSNLKRSKIVSIFILVFSLFTSIVILVGSIQVVFSRSIPLFRPMEEIRAFEFLAREAPEDSVVLASFQTSNPLPAWAPVSVITGHGPESTNLTEVEQLIHQFFSGCMTESDFFMFVTQYSIDYVFVGPIEKNLLTWDIAGSSALQLVYDSKNYQVYMISFRE